MRVFPENANAALVEADCWRIVTERSNKQTRRSNHEDPQRPEAARRRRLRHADVERVRASQRFDVDGLHAFSTVEESDTCGQEAWPRCAQGVVEGAGLQRIERLCQSARRCGGVIGQRPRWIADSAGNGSGQRRSWRYVGQQQADAVLAWEQLAVATTRDGVASR